MVVRGGRGAAGAGRREGGLAAAYRRGRRVQVWLVTNPWLLWLRSKYSPPAAQVRAGEQDTET
jgi:hypothetical protein